MKAEYLLLFIAIWVLTHFSSKAQQSRPATPNPQKDTNEAIMNTTSNAAMSCKLTTPELQERKATSIKQLKNKFTKKTELENGYSYAFNGTDKTLDMLTEFIKSERQCCDFFNFNIAVNNNGTITLSITGNKGAKEFIKSELEL